MGSSTCGEELSGASEYMGRWRGFPAPA